MKSKNKRIIIFLPWYGYGGSTLYLGQYVSYLVKNGYTVFAVCRKKEAGSDYLSSLGAIIKISHFPFALNFTALDIYSDSIKKRLIDCIKLFFGFFIALNFIIKLKVNRVIIGEFCQIPVILASILTKKRTICIFQTSISNSKAKRKVLFFLLKKVQVIIGITKLHVKDLPFEHKTFEVPNIYAPNKSLNSMNIPFEGFGNKKLIVFVGGNSRIKGTIHFVNIALELLKIRNDLRIVIIGRFHRNFNFKYAQGLDDADYKYNRQVVDLIGKHIDNEIFYIGEINNVDCWLRDSELLINTSIYPHFSRPIVEAWASNTLVAAFEDNYTKYMCHNRESILFLTKDNDSISAKAIDNLLNDENTRITMIESGKKTYEEFYSQQVFSNIMEKIF